LTKINITLTPETVRPKDSSSNPKTDIKITTTPSISGLPVTICWAEVENSGGHLHTGRPQGVFSEVSGYTGANGIFTTEYRPDEFSGQERIGAKILNVYKEKKLTVKIDGLTRYSNSNFIERSYHPKHSDPYYVDPAISGALDQIFNNFYNDTAHLYARLRVNDMSLEWGGKYDCDIYPNGGASWTSPHGNYHRKGRSVDIDEKFLDSSGNEVLISTYFSISDEFKDFIEDSIGYQLSDFLVEGSHYHLEF